MLQKLEPIDRLDIIWYLYLPQSLQQATNKKKEAAVVCRLHKFLQIVLETGENKVKLLHFLAERIISVATEGKQPCTTLENNILAARLTSLVSMI